MAATNRQLNWIDVSHGSSALTGITNVTFDQGAQVQTLSADDDRFETLAVLTKSKPMATVEMVDPAAAMAISGGTAADFTATHKDAKGATGGDIIYVLANAVAESAKTSGQHGSFGTASLSFVGISADGQTNPLSFTRV